MAEAAGLKINKKKIVYLRIICIKILFCPRNINLKKLEITIYQVPAIDDLSFI